MKKISICFLTLCFLAVAFCSSAQGYLTSSGDQIVDDSGNPFILKGMGLGGWMVQEGYMMQTADFASPQHKIRERIIDVVGLEETNLFYDRWLRNHVTKNDIDALASWGFNSVRLPMHYNLYTLPIEDEPVAGEQTWLEIGFELTDSLISWCKSNDMYVVLDLHAAPGGQGYDAAISDYDDTKPSLWEDKRNRDKTVALWRRLADRYKNEPFVAGYDLLNETNWDLPGGTLLRSLYREITEAIREVDQNHIIFIEGNWFANDFTGLTPPWDDKLVYSPHKYWSVNDQASIQWVLDLRENQNVPLYFGETGENSNTWFTEFASLLDVHEIGWAWWPMKKIASISGPTSIKRTAGYERLLRYWRGEGPKPSQTNAVAILKELTDNILFENCDHQIDVPDALFRQVEEKRNIPFKSLNIPGKIYAADFDLGGNEVGYKDVDVATYHLSNNMFTAWNTGWAYRNDGVDIEPTQDIENELGFNVGWADTDEWMAYTVEVAESGLYSATMRLAGGANGGTFRLLVDDATVTEPILVPNSGGYQNWTDVVVNDIALEAGKTVLKFTIESTGYNISSYEFVRDGSIADIESKFVYGETVNTNTIKLDFNKALIRADDLDKSLFSITINGQPVGLNAISMEDAGRSVWLELPVDIVAGYVLTASYDGTVLMSTDGLSVLPFSFAEIKNKISPLKSIPGRIEAEDFDNQSGIQLEETTDSGGGQNIGFLDVGDFCEYEVNVLFEGQYNMTFRTAGENQQGRVGLQLIDENGLVTELTEVFTPITGGWQTWQSTETLIDLPKGNFTLRLNILSPGFNVNWLEFSFNTSTADLDNRDISVYPNPVYDNITVTSDDTEMQQVVLYNISGSKMCQTQVSDNKHLLNIDLDGFSSGTYLLHVLTVDGKSFNKKIIVED